MNFRSVPCCGVAAALIFCASNALAADAALMASNLPEQIVVTGTRTAIAFDQALAPITVIDQTDIETHQVVTFQELLSGQPGIQVSNNGGLGKISSVFLRGTNSDHVLVLVNGVRMGSSSAGTTAFQYLPVDSIDHVEIVRGPLSSLYGSEAIGGVIQIFTRRATADGIHFSAEAAAGSHRTSDVSASVDGRSGAFSYALSAGNLTSDGYPNCTGAPYVSPASPGGGCYINDPANDGYHNVSGSALVRYEFSPTADVETSFLRAQGGVRYAGPYTNHEDYAQQAASLAGHWAPTSSLKLTAQVGRSEDNALDTLDFVEPAGNLFDTTRTSASLQADWQMTTGQLLTLGGDYLHDHLSSDAGFPVDSRNITGIFGEYQATLGAQQLAVAARHDANTQFGGKTTGSVSWGYRFDPSLRFTASAGTAFHAPSFNDLYYPYFGNPTLRPETSRTIDIGLDGKFAATHAAVHVFQTRVTDLISYDAVLFAPENTDAARIRGVELQAGTAVGAWTGELTTAWLDARNDVAGSPNYRNELPRRSRWTGRLEVARSWTDLRAAVQLDTASMNYDDIANAQPLAGYTTATVLLEWSPVANWMLQGKLANATDRRYQTAFYYPQDGRDFMITLRYRPTHR